MEHPKKEFVAKYKKTEEVRIYSFVMYSYKSLTNFICSFLYSQAKIVMDDKLIISYSRRWPGLTPEETKRVRAYYAHNCKHPSFATKLTPSSVEYTFNVVSDWLLV